MTITGLLEIRDSDGRLALLAISSSLALFETQTS